MQLPSLLSTSPLPMLRVFTHGERLVGSFKSLQSSPKSQSGTTFGGREAEGLSCRSGLPNVASAHPEVTVMFSDIVSAIRMGGVGCKGVPTINELERGSKGRGKRVGKPWG